MAKDLETVVQGVLIAEEVNGADDKGSGATAVVDIERLLEFFLEYFWTWEYFPQLLNYQYFQSISFWIKGIVLYISFHNCRNSWHICFLHIYV